MKCMISQLFAKMICRKCELASTLTIRKEYNYCDCCFLSYVDHKFRACLGKNKKLKANEKVLVCLSGGISSTALLDLVHQSISLSSHKKLRVVPYFLHVTGIYESPNDEIVKKSIIEQCNKYNFQVHIVHINHYFSTSDILSNLDSNETHAQIGRWKTSNTTKSDILTQIIQNLFICVAKKLQCRIIFTGETTTTLAVNLLSNIAIGRGSQIENNIGFCDMKDKDAQILRPMRDITLEEVENYVKIKSLGPASTSCIQQNCLQSLIQNFVSGLQENFPATLTTICKTADKMSSNSDTNEIKKCSFCMNLLYNDTGKLTAAEATIFSSFVSSKKSDINNTTPDLNGHLELSLNNENLCYCCSTSISELSKSNETNDIQKMLNRS